MRNSLYIIIATLLIGLFCPGFRCNREEIVYKHNFVEKINLFPFQKSYKVGDTIWLQYVNQNNRLFDQITNKFVAADTISIDFQVSFNRRYNSPVDPPGGFCDFITSSGVNIGRYLGVYGTGFLNAFGCNSTDNYDFLVGVVPKHKGIYSLDLLGSPRPVSPCPSRTSIFPQSTIEYRFNTVDGNKEVYLSIPPNSRGETTKGYTEGKIDNKQVYIVNVE